MMQRGRRTPRAWVLGAGTGMFTVIWFTILHDLFIHDVWVSFEAMLVAGSACGGGLAWNHDVLFDTPSVSTWARFLLLHLASLLLLGIVSMAVFEPEAPIALVTAASRPPAALVGRATPLAVGCVLSAASVSSALWGRSSPKFAANLIGSSMLVVVLGRNVSVLGLVDPAVGTRIQLFLILGLTTLIVVGYGGVFAAVARSYLPAPDTVRRVTGGR